MTDIERKPGDWSKGWNPYYAAYAQEHGREPEEMLKYDRERCPGGHMGEFIRWNSARWSEWRKINGRAPYSPVDAADSANFMEWLLARLEPPKEGESQNST